MMRYLTEDGYINDDGRERLLKAVESLMQMARRHSPDEMLTIVTSAIREAVNGDEILAEIDSRIDGDLQVLSGDAEAAATFFAARRWFGWGAGQLLVLDIGGGSLEVAAGMNEIPDVAESVPLGAGRLTRNYLHHDPPTKKEFKELRRMVRASLTPLVTRVLARSSPDWVVATSKTFRSLARLAGMRFEGMGPDQRWKMSTSQLKDWVPRLAKIPAKQRMELPGITAERTYQIVAGAVVASEVLQQLKIETIEICPWALREGALLQRIDQM